MHEEDAVIIDYGLGNLFSLQRVIEHLGKRSRISDDVDVLRSARRLILPGVGAFEDGIRNLRERSLDRAVSEFVRSGRPLLGICLGMQLFMDESEENGVHQGLGLIPGRVVRFKAPAAQESNSFKVPQIGWNTLEPSGAGDRCWENTILHQNKPGSFFYFVHSYVVCPQHHDTVLAETEYGTDRFCSVLRQDNIWGCQFHPEVSGQEGLKLLHQFLFHVQ